MFDCLDVLKKTWLAEQTEKYATGSWEFNKNDACYVWLVNKTMNSNCLTVWMCSKIRDWLNKSNLWDWRLCYLRLSCLINETQSMPACLRIKHAWLNNHTFYEECKLVSCLFEHWLKNYQKKQLWLTSRYVEGWSGCLVWLWPGTEIDWSDGLLKDDYSNLLAIKCEKNYISSTGWSKETNKINYNVWSLSEVEVWRIASYCSCWNRRVLISD